MLWRLPPREGFNKISPPKFNNLLHLSKSSGWLQMSLMISESLALQVDLAALGTCFNTASERAGGSMWTFAMCVPGSPEVVWLGRTMSRRDDVAWDEVATPALEGGCPDPGHGWSWGPWRYNRPLAPKRRPIFLQTGHIPLEGPAWDRLTWDALIWYTVI